MLRRLFRRAGKGAVKEVEKGLGIADGSFRQWRRRRKLEVGVLFRALGELGVSPARFWVEVFGTDFEPVELARRPAGRPKDPVVRNAVQRWEAPELRCAAELTEDDLRELDVLRDEDPALVVRKARTALKDADRKWLPRLLAVYGSARRAQARLEEAREALLFAQELADRCGDRGLAADVLQRLGVVCAYEGNIHLALLCAKQACYEHQMMGNVRGEARTWVDQGEYYFHLGQLDHSITAHKRALVYLPEDEVRNRFTAYQMLALLYQRQKDLAEALNYVKFAETLGPRVAKALLGRLIWTKAEIASTLADYGLAERCYAEALEIFRTRSPIDAALASVEQARVQVLQGKFAEARETTKAMMSLLRYLEKNRLVGAVLIQLSQIAFDGGRLTDRLLGQAALKIRKERAGLDRPTRFGF